MAYAAAVAGLPSTATNHVTLLTDGEAPPPLYAPPTVITHGDFNSMDLLFQLLTESTCTNSHFCEVAEANVDCLGVAGALKMRTGKCRTGKYGTNDVVIIKDQI